MSHKMMIVMGLLASVFFLAACGASAEVQTPSPASSATAAAEQTPVATPEALATEPPAPSDVSSIVAAITREVNERIFTETVWSMNGEEPTIEDVWVEGESFEWGGELIIWFEVRSAFDEWYTHDISAHSEYMQTARWLLPTLVYESGVVFDKLYLGSSYEGRTAPSYRYYSYDAVQEAEGDYEELFLKYVRTSKGLPPWEAEGK